MDHSARPKRCLTNNRRTPVAIREVLIDECRAFNKEIWRAGKA